MPTLVYWPCTEFNTARWSKNLTSYDWPGPLKWENNKTIEQNFTCYFKVRRQTETEILRVFTVQGFRQPPPKELPLTEKWHYNLNVHFYFIYFLKLLFIVFFEVMIRNKEVSKLMSFLAHCGNLGGISEDHYLGCS